MELDVSILSRIQFAFTVSFHIIFPSITIGLATLIAIWEGLWLKTGNPSICNWPSSGSSRLPLPLVWALYPA